MTDWQCNMVKIIIQEAQSVISMQQSYVVLYWRTMNVLARFFKLSAFLTFFHVLIFCLQRLFYFFPTHQKLKNLDPTRPNPTHGQLCAVPPVTSQAPPTDCRTTTRWYLVRRHNAENNRSQFNVTTPREPTVCRYNWHTAGSRSWPFPML